VLVIIQGHIRWWLEPSHRLNILALGAACIHHRRTACWSNQRKEDSRVGYPLWVGFKGWIMRLDLSEVFHLYFSSIHFLKSNLYFIYHHHVCWEHYYSFPRPREGKIHMH
jgi:hypothetical protein